MALVKVEYLHALLREKKRVPCRQQLPETAIYQGKIDDTTLVLFLSYCWCTRDHPDPDCKVLADLCQFTSCSMAYAAVYEDVFS